MRWVLVCPDGGGLCVNPHGRCLRGTVSTSPYSVGSKQGRGRAGHGGYEEGTRGVRARRGVHPVCLCALFLCAVVGGASADVSVSLKCALVWILKGE